MAKRLSGKIYVDVRCNLSDSVAHITPMPTSRTECFKPMRSPSFPRFLMVIALGATVMSGLSARAESPSAPWPQTLSDLSAEPGVRFGTLENGMRFAIMRNATPSGQAAIRFRIGPVSIDENDNQQG